MFVHFDASRVFHVWKWQVFEEPSLLVKKEKFKADKNLDRNQRKIMSVLQNLCTGILTYHLIAAELPVNSKCLQT